MRGRTTSTSFIVDFGDGVRDELRGFGLTCSSRHQPIAGVITSFAETDNGTRLAYAYGFSVSAAAVAAAVRTVSVSDDNAIVRAALAGNDIITGGELRDYLSAMTATIICPAAAETTRCAATEAPTSWSVGWGIDTDFGNAIGNNDTMRLENAVMPGLGRTGAAQARHVPPWY